MSSSTCFLRERRHLGALEVEHADAAILQQQRNHQLGPDVLDGVDVARILRHVVHQHRLLVERGVADEPLAELHRLERARVVAVLDRQLHLQHLARFVEQGDAEDAVVDDPLDQVREPRQQLVEIEDRAHLAPDLRQRLERLRVLALRLEQPRVDDGLRDVGAELPQDDLVAFGERGPPIAQQVERADDAALVPQRHRQLRADAGHRLQVARVGVDVVEQDGPPLRDRGADDALSRPAGGRCARPPPGSRPRRRCAGPGAARPAGTPRTR